MSGCLGGKRPLWRVVEEMSPLERRKVFTTHFSEHGGVSIEVVDHTDYYIKVRQSFTGSREWKLFRAVFLERNPSCIACNTTKNLHVHHKGLYTVDVTLINEGFLLPLTCPERFESLCGDCHYRNHELMIKGEKKQKKPWMVALDIMLERESNK